MRHRATHAYVLDLIRRSAPHGRVLDYGCGAGQVVMAGRATGLEIDGADTYEGRYFAPLRPASPHIHAITSGRIPVADATYDMVVANQVFEHIADPRPVLREIRRVLKPGGVFFAAFPLHETWYEGHVGLYFSHRLQPWPTLQRRYLALAHRCGFGRDRRQDTAQTWAARYSDSSQTVCFYHRRRDVVRWWRDVFGTPPVSLAGDYVAFRLRRHLPSLMARAICRVRVGALLLAH